MKNRVLVGTVLICILAGAFVCATLAQGESLLGVKEGDNFTYNFIVNWSSTDPNQVVPQAYSDMNQTLSIHFNVTAVGSTIAYLDINKTMRGGQTDFSQGYIEVQSGRGVDALLFIIGANLTSGQKAYPGSDPAAVTAGVSAESFTIKDTVAKMYLGVSKMVNHYSETVTNSTTGDYVTRNAYYEQSTGVLMELTLEHYWASLGETDSETWKITQFNSAVAPATTDNSTNTNQGLPSWLVPAVVVAVVVVVAVLIVALVVISRKKPKVQAVTPPPAPAQPQTPA
jgi:hypothetical protein